MIQRGVGAPPSAVKDITTSVCSDGKKVQSDSQRQPFSPMIRHGQGQVHNGTPCTPISTCSWSLQTSQFSKTKEATTVEMSSISTDASEGKRSLLSIQKISRS